jgi:hypothetical protein
VIGLVTIILKREPHERQLAIKVICVMEGMSMKSKAADGRTKGRAKKLVSVPTTKLNSGRGVLVSVPVDAEDNLDEKGRVRSIESGQPDPEAIAEAAHYVKTLEDNQQVADDSGPCPPDATHEIETDEKGRKRLVQKRYSAF